MFDKRLVKNFDFLILLTIICLAGIGLVGIGIATRQPTEGQRNIIEIIASFNLKYVQLHLIWFISGLFLLFLVTCFDYHIYGDFSEYLYWLVVGLLVYVEFKGNIAGGAQSWINIGPYKLQPSEFAKLSIILIVAKILSKKKEDEEEEEDEKVVNLKKLFSIAWRVAIPLGLILFQPDYGTAMVIVVIVFGMVFIAGISYKLLLGIMGAGIAAFPFMWYGVFTESQKDRIRVFLNPNLDSLGSGYNVLQSITAIGSGQIYGKGILTDNTLSQLNFLPAKHTDFIFAVTVEALGFVGGITIITLFLILVLRTIRLARKAKDLFGSLIVVGVVCMIVFHIFENIGMTMGLMPVTGIPLPFLSYGGSSMWTNMIAYGLVLNVGMRRQKIKF